MAGKTAVSRKAENQKPSALSREDVFVKIAEGAVYGNLGMFIGAGLPLAVVPNAFSWGELLKECAREFRISYRTRIREKGNSFPQIASMLCKEISRTNFHVGRQHFIKGKDC
jgi:hypothetical protein